MNTSTYTDAAMYELLVVAAFDCLPGMKHGAHLCFMDNAMSMERGETAAKYLGSFEKQLKEVKKYLSKALIKLTQKKPYSTESEFFKGLESQVESSGTTNELMKIVNLALDKIIEIKKS